MKTIVKLHVLFLIISSFFACSTNKNLNKNYIPASDPHFSYIGRYLLKESQEPIFTYPGFQIRAIFEGTSISVCMKPNSGYFMVEIDHSDPFKIAFLKKDSILLLTDSLKDKLHEIKITHVNEGIKNTSTFQGFLLDKGKKLSLSPVLPNRHIEFIGNSITCGYGVETLDKNEGFKDETENHYYSFAAITARAFNTQSLVVARSGIGIYRNYNGPKEGNKDCMPNIYTQTLFKNSNFQWDFKNYNPDLVIVNLGTNDVSTNNYDTSLLENAYRNFLVQLRGYYPKTKILFLTGPMLNKKPLKDVQKALNNVVKDAILKGDKMVYRFDLSPMDGSLGYGASWHPSKAQQYKSAEELIPFIAQLMNWKRVHFEE